MLRNQHCSNCTDASSHVAKALGPDVGQCKNGFNIAQAGWVRFVLVTASTLDV